MSSEPFEDKDRDGLSCKDVLQAEKMTYYT